MNLGEGHFAWRQNEHHNFVFSIISTQFKKKNTKDFSSQNLMEPLEGEIKEIDAWWQLLGCKTVVSPAVSLRNDWG